MQCFSSKNFDSFSSQNVAAFLHQSGNIRDFQIWYGWAVVRWQIVKITSGDALARVPVCGIRERKRETSPFSLPYPTCRPPAFSIVPTLTESLVQANRSLVFCYGKVPNFTYSSLREYNSTMIHRNNTTKQLDFQLVETANKPLFSVETCKELYC